MIVNEVLDERKKQDKRWGGAEHDDQHRPAAWFGFIDDQMAKSDRDTARYAAAHGLIDPETIPSVEDWKRGRNFVRARLVKIAALAIAGIESIDRLNARNYVPMPEKTKGTA